MGRLPKDLSVDKEAALKTLRSSPFIALQHPDISTRLTRIRIRAEMEPVLLFWQSEAVGWIRMEGNNAVWRFGSMITGGSSMPRALGDPLVDEGRSVAEAIGLAWVQIKPESPSVESQGGEPERFAGSIEAGERPKP